MNLKLTQKKLAELFQTCIEGGISKADLSESHKAQLLNYANQRIYNKRKDLFELLNKGFLTQSHINNDLEGYLKTQVKQEQTIIEWLSKKYISITIEQKDLNEKYLIEKKESADLFEACSKEAEKIKNIEKEIEFWNNKKTEYLKNLPLNSFNVSAMVTKQNGQEIEIFFDKLVTDKVKQLIQLSKIKNTIPQVETKTDKLKAELIKYGFFELLKVKQLSEPNKQSLVELISTNGLPYSIAMFDFLGFLKHIESEYFKTKYKLNIEVAKWFNSDKDGRAVKGNISSLSDYSTENKSKYTAHTHKETVKKDYQKLK